MAKRFAIWFAFETKDELQDVRLKLRRTHTETTKREPSGCLDRGGSLLVDSKRCSTRRHAFRSQTFRMPVHKYMGVSFRRVSFQFKPPERTKGTRKKRRATHIQTTRALCLNKSQESFLDSEWPWAKGLALLLVHGRQRLQKMNPEYLGPPVERLEPFLL